MVKLDHLGIGVRNAAASRHWYVNTIGLTLEFETTERGVVGLQDNAGFTLILHETSPVQAPTGFMLYFQVDDVDATYRSLSATGVAFVHAPMKVPWGYGAELLDPNGYRVGLWDETSMHQHGQG